LPNIISVLLKRKRKRK